MRVHRILAIARAGSRNIRFSDLVRLARAFGWREARVTLGPTPAEALAEVERTRAAWLEAARTLRKPIPTPRYRAPIYKTA